MLGGVSIERSIHAKQPGHHRILANVSALALKYCLSNPSRLVCTSIFKEWFPAGLVVTNQLAPLFMMSVQWSSTRFVETMVLLELEEQTELGLRFRLPIVYLNNLRV